MFKKKAQIKPYAPLRSSDRRKIAQSLIDEFGLTPPPSDDRDAVVVALRNSLLPENTTSAKFSTNLGPELDQVVGVVYVGAHRAEEAPRPLWVRCEGMMFPTVYTLWKNPRVLPILHTHSSVVGKLYTGADLMIPGLIGPPFPARAKKGGLVGIASMERPTVVLAVGIAEVDVYRLEKVVGEKGKAVRVLHWWGDELTGAGGSAGEVPEKVEGVFDEEGMFNGEVEGEGEEEEENGGVSLEGLLLEEEGAEEGGKTEEMEEKTEEQQQQQQPQLAELTTKEIDDAFYNAAIYGLHHHLQTNTHTTIETPITPSAFMSTLVLPFLPPSAYFNADTGSISSVHPALQIKKSSWKNITKFLKYLDKEQFLKTKNRQGNEVVVVDIDWDDERIKSFTPYKLPVPTCNITSTNTSSTSGSSSQAPHPATSTGPLKILELYKPTPKLSPIFSAINANPKDIYTPADLKSHFNTYLTNFTTPHATNPRLVILTPVLSSLLPSSSPTTSPRDTLTRTLLTLCTPYYLVLKPGETYPNPGLKPTQGEIPKVTITTEHKRGKVMTRISGVERFSIDPVGLGEELRVRCASSASVAQVLGGKGAVEIMVQGPQEKIVKERLLARGVPVRCIVSVDRQGKKKK